MIMCAHKASGDPTVQSAVPARTEGPAPPRTAHVCAHLDTGGLRVKEVSVRLKANCLELNALSENCQTERRTNKLHHNPDLVLIFEWLANSGEALDCLS